MKSTVSAGVLLLLCALARDAARLAGFLVLAITDEDGRSLVRVVEQDGTIVDQRAIATRPPANDPRVATLGDHILAAARLPGEAVVLTRGLDVVQDPGALFDNPHLASSARGFVGIGTDASVSDSVLTFLDLCE